MNFIFGIHIHQPIGNFDYVIEHNFNIAYKPFLDTIIDFENLPFAMHISGPLLDWIKNNQPNYIEIIKNLVDKDRLELLSSGYYEPLLASISDEDKIGQIKMMNEQIENIFGCKPKGLWLTERVWEPGLVCPIVDSDIEYVLVDDYHIKTSTETKYQLYFTEDQRKTLKVFSISEKLRYLIPFLDSSKTIDFLNKLRNDDVVVFMDDGEKFGSWPGTNDLCYGKQKWLYNFLSLINKNLDTIKIQTFSQYLSSNNPKEKIYMPTSSYSEMDQWTLPSNLAVEYDNLNLSSELSKFKFFLKGGMWRNFLTKYSESNWMINRANYLSTLTDDILIKKNIWAAQCNCAYWHGVFGGLYLPHLRHGLYEKIIEAEKMMDIEDGFFDIDLDGNKELLLSNDYLKLFISPINGSIRELDLIKHHFNLVNTMRRYKEFYHMNILNQTQDVIDNNETHSIHNQSADGLEIKNDIIFDNHDRWLLIDHFYESKVEAKDLLYNKYKEAGDFINALYDINFKDDNVTIQRLGKVLNQDVLITKTIMINTESIFIKIELQNLSEENLNCYYNPEMNFSLLGGHTKDRYYKFGNKKHYLDSIGKFTGSDFSIINDYDKFKININSPLSNAVLYYPVQTISISESGYDKIYQSSVINPIYSINIKPKEIFEINLSLKITCTNK
tara:strand:+ start:3272 stop:5278 length:2007 start_codon:yes stop_codon:yes gene_type:complete